MLFDGAGYAVSQMSSDAANGVRRLWTSDPDPLGRPISTEDPTKRGLSATWDLGGRLSLLEELRAGVGIDAKTKLYRGSGCARCNGEGFKGRAGVYELLVVGAPLKEAIGRGATAQEIKAIAEQNAAYAPLSR